MGLFGKKDKTKRTLLEKHAEMSREKAEKLGLLEADPLLVIRGYDDGRHTFFVLYEDRIELHTGRKMGGFTMDGIGVTEISLSSITSVGIEATGMGTAKLKLSGSGLDVEHHLPGGEIAEGTRRRISQARAAA